MIDLGAWFTRASGVRGFWRHKDLWQSPMHNMLEAQVKWGGTVFDCGQMSPQLVIEIGKVSRGK